MSEDKNKRYSIWGRFDDLSTSAIKQIQQNVNSKLMGPKFEPHLTLSGFFKLNPSLREDLRTFSFNNKERLIKTKSYGIKNEFFQSLYIEVEKSEPLNNLKNRLDVILDHDSGEFFPHISLFYGMEPASKKQKVIDMLSDFPKEITLNKLSIVYISEDIESWEVIDEFPLLEKAFYSDNLGRPI
jgi:2'-5' RNA ligase